MRIRYRLGGAIVTVLPVILLYSICLNIWPDYKSFFDIAYFLFAIIGVLFSKKIYFYVFYNANSTCAIYAGNLALKHGYSPRAEDGTAWNPREYKVSQIYDMYPNKRLLKPEEGTAGFVFKTNKKGTFARKVEFYDYRNGGDAVTYWKFLFDSEYENGDTVVKSEIPLSITDWTRRYVALKRI